MGRCGDVTSLVKWPRERIKKPNLLRGGTRESEQPSSGFRGGVSPNIRAIILSSCLSVQGVWLSKRTLAFWPETLSSSKTCEEEEPHDGENGKEVVWWVRVRGMRLMDGQHSISLYMRI